MVMEKISPIFMILIKLLQELRKPEKKQKEVECVTLLRNPWPRLPLVSGCHAIPFVTVVYANLLSRTCHV